MSEQQQNNFSEKPVEALPNMANIVEQILTKRPEYVIVADAHVNSKPQEVATALIEQITKNKNYKPGMVGFYVEALDSDSDPANGKMTGGVLNHDNDGGKTAYRKSVEKVLALGVNVKGVDVANTSWDSQIRMDNWEKVIKSGNEPIKILLIGGGHLWNDSKKPFDLIARLGKTQWIIGNQEGYSPPGYSEIIQIDISKSVNQDRKHKITKYILS